MSLYNMINGLSQATFWVLPMLGKHPDQYPRFRDCFIADDEYPQWDNYIHVYTRVGGGNREDYVVEISELQEMDGYVTDYDDSFDNTYASFVFAVPEKWKADYDHVLNGNYTQLSDEYVNEICRVFPKLTEQIKEVVTHEVAD